MTAPPRALLPALLLLVGACSNGSSGDAIKGQGSGGTPAATGGSVGTGGAAGGAAAGTAGASGGAPGAAGAGGAQPTDGATTDAQRPAPDIVGVPLATFDTDTDGFVLDTYHDASQTNLGDPSWSGLPPTLSYDPGDGSPTAGCLQIIAPFSGANQYVDVQKALGSADQQNWSGGKLHVRIEVTRGTFTGFAEPYVDTGLTYTFGGTAINFAAASGWQEFVIDLDHPMTMNAGYDPTHVVLFGLHLATGAAGASAGLTGFCIDSFSIVGAPPNNGG
jgi:hypothetical protein